MSGIDKYPAQYFTQLLDCPNTYTANDIIVVNSTGTGLTEVAPTSLLPAVGTGVTNDIPVFSGSVPPLLSDSGCQIVPVFGGLSIQNLTGNINLVGSTNAEVLGSNTVSMTESTDAHSLQMSSVGVTLNSGNSLPMALSASTTLTLTSTGNLLLNINGASYVWPTSQAVGVCHLTNDGSGNLSWTGGA